MSTAASAIADVRMALRGLPVFIAGSSVAAAQYDNISDNAFDDVDVFTPTSHALVHAVNALQNAGYFIDVRHKRLWERWLKYGMKGWHTNSIKLEHELSGLEVNVIYKLVDGHATTSLSQVIESFDFGLLAIGGWETETDTYRDLRSYLFPSSNHYSTAAALPFLPNKRAAWQQGFISQYNGLRQAGRYVKYIDYGYDLSLIKDDMITGYSIASQYLSDKDSVEKQKLGEIYNTLATEIDRNELSKLREVSKTILYKDSLDEIMESLE